MAHPLDGAYGKLVGSESHQASKPSLPQGPQGLEDVGSHPDMKESLSGELHEAMRPHLEHIANLVRHHDKHGHKNVAEEHGHEESALEHKTGL